MRYKNERVYIYKIDFEGREGSDYGFEMIEAHNTDEAIEIFRSYLPYEKYKITNVYRKINGSWDNDER